jgi:hypothetical protein
MAFLCIGISAFLCLSPETAPADPQLERLLARSWVWASPPCENLGGTGFYELESESSNREFYLVDDARALAPRENWPEGPFTCRPLTEPSFVEEIE